VDRRLSQLDLLFARGELLIAYDGERAIMIRRICVGWRRALLTRPVISYSTLVFCSGASRAGIGRPGTSCVGAAGRSAAVC